MMADFTTLVTGLTFTECPRWHDGRLYFSDFHSHRVLAVACEGPHIGVLETIAKLDGQPGGFGWLPDGSMLIASKHERHVLQRESDGTLHLYADLTSIAPWHVNDMLVDSAGRAWVGNYGFDLDGGAPVKLTGIICVDTDRHASMVTGGLGFPNGMAITPDGRTLIVAESVMNRLTSFDLMGPSLSNRRTWAAFGEIPKSMDTAEIMAQVEVIPDGICLDAEGAVWVADVVHHRLIRVAEGGTILDQRETCGIPAFACMLGGEDRRTLFACVAPSFVEAEAAANPRSAVLMTRVEVPGAGLP
jgi:sugar lactone lactonase YvrE